MRDLLTTLTAPLRALEKLVLGDQAEGLTWSSLAFHAAALLALAWLAWWLWQHHR